MKRAVLLLCVAGCGDPLLPADFTGPPEAKIGATVLVPTDGYQEAARPKLSITWLSSLQVVGTDETALFGQTVSFSRSAQLRQDWDIGLTRPSDTARTVLSAAESDLSLLVGKMVYFDDRNGNGVLDWNCKVGKCDLVQAVSEEFVVYARKPIFCQPTQAGTTTDRLAEQRLAVGYHYFDYRGAVPVEIAAGDGLKFLVNTDAAPIESDLAGTLRVFTSRLLRNFSLDALGGCTDMVGPTLP